MWCEDEVCLCVCVGVYCDFVIGIGEHGFTQATKSEGIPDKDKKKKS